MEALEAPEELCEVKAEIEQACKHHCKSLAASYGACLERIANLDKMPEKALRQKCELQGIATKDFTGGIVPRETLVEQLSEKANCVGQYFSYFHCIDHCAAPKLFKRLQ